MTSAVLDDIGSLALVAILVPLTSGATVTGVDEIALIIGKVFTFFVLVWVTSA